MSCVLGLRLAGFGHTKTENAMKNTHHLDPASEVHAERLAEDPKYRILRAMPLPFASMPSANGTPPDGRCVALVDLETTALDPELDAIIEIAVKLVWVDEAGQVIGHLPIYSWLEDPGHALEPRIVQITGLRDEDLAGKHIDDEAVARLLERADLIVAHNARFDCPWIVRRWPQLADKAWACSLREIDWSALGFTDGHGLQHLLYAHGWFSRATHRAAADVWSLFWLLQQERWDPVSEEGDACDGEDHDEAERTLRTHLQRLLEASSAMTMKFLAVGAPYSMRHLLRARGYHWDAGADRVWWREVAEADAEAEQIWLRRNGIAAPRCLPISARERHR